MERSLFADLQKGKEINQLKRDYIKTFEVTARQFNACRISLQGKIESIKQICLQQRQTLKEKIASLSQKIPKIKNDLVRHQKQRKLGICQNKLDGLNTEKGSLCFGSRKLFHAQFHVKKSGYASFKEWKEAWQDARNSEFLIIGSKDETTGNQSCLLLQQEGKLCLKLRLPNKLTKTYGKYATICIDSLSYGRKELEKALLAKTALTYRFKKEQKKWTVFISFAQEPVPLITSSMLGAIGIDLNVNHVAAVEIDAKGNPLRKKRFSLTTYGKTKDQAKALIGDVSKQLIAFAKEKKKPIVLEKLDFTKKKQSLKEISKKQARMLSSFHYKEFLSHVQAKAFREGVEVLFVNPAMSSIIGKIKFSKRYGLTVHQAAALCIARRFYQFSERPSQCPMKVVHKNIQVAFPLPARNRRKHVWTFWKEASLKLKAALAAHFRDSPVPLACRSG